MNFFSIDCSTDIGSLFIKFKNRTFSKVLQSDKSNIDLLMKEILDFFEENNLKFDNISKIFVNQGPGNFSGLRGSISIAKGISLSKKIDLFGYDSFIWSCVDYFEKKEPVYSIIKFREKYFIKKFTINFKNQSKIKLISIDELLKEYENNFKVIPKNFVKNFDKKILKLNNLRIENLDHNKLEFLQLNGLLDKDLIKPLYLS